MEARCSLSVAVKVWRALSDEGSNLLETYALCGFPNNLCGYATAVHPQSSYVFCDVECSHFPVHAYVHECMQGYAFVLVSIIANHKFKH